MSSTINTDFSLLSSDFLNKFPDFPKQMSAISQFVFLRTYSRLIPSLRRRETYKEVCRRVACYNVSLAINHLNKIGYSINMLEMKKEAEMIFINMFNLRQFPSGRTMFVGGSKAVDNGALCNYNCSFINVKSWNDLCDLFYVLLVGTGVGFKSTQEMAANMPPIRVNVKLIHSPYKSLPKNERLEDTDIHIWKNGYAKIFIGDSKLGWVKALQLFFDILTKKEYESIHTIKISYDSLRPKGERLKTFGGYASGHKTVEDMFEGIHRCLIGTLDTDIDPIIPDKNGYGHVRPIHILDIGNLIGNNVCVGGVRRTAEIFLFDYDDYETLFAKYGINGMYTEENIKRHQELGHELDLIDQANIEKQKSNPDYKFKYIKPKWFDKIGQIGEYRKNHHRRMSNNSICFTSKPSIEFLNLVYRIMRDAGEPGFINLDEARKRRPNAEGLNPCLTADTVIMTSNGLRPIHTLIGKQFTAVIDGKKYNSTNEGFWLTGEKQTMKITLENGQILKATNNHKFLTTLEDGSEEWKEVSELTNKNYLILNNNSGYKWGNHGKAYDEYNKGYHSCSDPINFSIVEQETSYFLMGFLARLFEDVNTIQTNQYDKSTIYVTGSLENLQSLQRILLAVGINNSTISLCDNELQLLISGKEDFQVIDNNINQIFNNIQNNKDYKLNKVKILAIEPLGIEKVYDATIPGIHMFIANGIKSHNCSEILLDSYGVCNLTTVNICAFVHTDTYGNNIIDLQGLEEAQKLSARIGLRMTLVPLELPNWDKVQQRDRLLGCSITGFKDAMDRLNYNVEQENKLIKFIGDISRNEAARYAKEMRVNEPLLVNCVKPEGSLSVVANAVSCGLHMSHSPYYIRRIRISAADPLAKAIQQLGWSIHPEVGTKGDSREEQMANATTLVIDFPVSTGAKRTKFDITVEEQLNTYFNFQKLYTDHNSSNTITVRNHEWDKLKEIIYTNWDNFIGVSFLSLDEHSYHLAPYEACDEKTYMELQKITQPVDINILSKYELVDDYHNKESDINNTRLEGDEKTHEDIEDKNYMENEVKDSVEIKLDEIMMSDCSGGVCPIR